MDGEVCAVCMEPLESDGRDEEVLECESCGERVHESCGEYVASDFWCQSCVEDYMEEG